MIVIAKQNFLNLDGLEDFSHLIRNKLLCLPHQVATFQRSQVIYHQGAKLDKVGFILEGVMKVANYTNAGNELNPHYFYEGEIFPEYLLFTGEDEYVFSLVREKRSKVILVDYQCFKDFVMYNMECCQLLIAYMAKRGLLAEKWRLCNSFGNLRGRIAYMLLEIYGDSDDGWIENKR